MQIEEKPVTDVPVALPDGDRSDATDDDVSPAATPSTTAPQSQQPSIPSLRPTKDMTAGISASSTHLGQINAARRGPAPRPPASMSAAPSGGLNQDILAKMKAFSLSRQGAPPSLPHAASSPTIPSLNSPGAPNGGVQSPPSGGPIAGPLPGPLPGRLPPQARPNAKNWVSSPTVAGSAAANAPKPTGSLAAKRMKPGLKLSDAAGPNGSSPGKPSDGPAPGGESVFSKYSEFVDTKTGTLNFKNKAVIHGGGVEFSSGHSFNISLDEVDRLDELGKGNYGTVYKVRHSRPHMRKPGRA